MKNLSLPKGRAKKLLPHYIGPYKILEARLETSNYVLDLPMQMISCGIHPVFHISLLKPQIPNDDYLFPNRKPEFFYDFGKEESDKLRVDAIIGHQWISARSVSFIVLWDAGDMTTEPYATCKDLEALDDYLRLQGVDTW